MIVSQTCYFKMTSNLVCNFKKCRKSLTDQAWVTICSHAFCMQHGLSEFAKKATSDMKCPACDSDLIQKFEVIRTDLKPPESFRSIVLAGMQPDIIMDIAMRAMSFWSYQIEQEARYQENVAKHLKEKLDCFQEINTLNMQKIKSELSACKRKLENLQSEHAKTKKQSEEFMINIEEKNRKIQKLTLELEKKCRKDINVIEREERKSEWNNVPKIYEARSIDRFIFKPAETPSLHNTTPLLRNRLRKNDVFQFNPVIK